MGLLYPIHNKLFCQIVFCFARDVIFKRTLSNCCWKEQDVAFTMCCCCDLIGKYLANACCFCLALFLTRRAYTWKCSLLWRVPRATSPWTWPSEFRFLRRQQEFYDLGIHVGLDRYRERTVCRDKFQIWPIDFSRPEALTTRCPRSFVQTLPGIFKNDPWCAMNHHNSRNLSKDK